MYISCKTLWDAGITKDQVSCCGSCHDDEEYDPVGYGLREIYEDEIGLPRTEPFGKVVGHICCAVSHYLDDTGKRTELLKQVYEMQEAA